MAVYLPAVRCLSRPLSMLLFRHVAIRRFLYYICEDFNGMKNISIFVKNNSK
jgi:hypothetical protein